MSNWLLQNYYRYIICDKFPPRTTTASLLLCFDYFFVSQAWNTFKNVAILSTFITLPLSLAFIWLSFRAELTERCSGCLQWLGVQLNISMRYILAQLWLSLLILSQSCVFVPLCFHRLNRESPIRTLKEVILQVWSFLKWIIFQRTIYYRSWHSIDVTLSYTKKFFYLILGRFGNYVFYNLFFIKDFIKFDQWKIKFF